MLDKIKKYVDRELEIDISTRSNKTEYTFGRAIFFELCTDYYKCSTQKMADAVGLKSHAAVLNSKSETFPYAISFPRYKEAYLRLDSLMKGFDKEPYTQIKILEQEVEMLRKEVDRLRMMEFTKKLK